MSTFINFLAALQVVILVCIGAYSTIGLAGELGILGTYQEGPWYKYGWIAGISIAVLIAIKPKLVFGLKD